MKPYNPIRTEVAMRAVTVSEMFTATFHKFRLSGTTPRTPELATPEEQSTGGGERATQSIILAPEDPAAGTLIAGTFNAAENRAELRGYPYLEATYRIRYGGKRMDIPAGSYQKFLEQAQRFFQSQGYMVKVVNQLPESLKRHYDAAVQKAPTSGAVWALLLLFLLLGAGAVAYLLLYT